MLLSSFLVFFSLVNQPEATYPIDSSRLKTCGIYAQSTIFGSVSLFIPLGSPKPHFKANFASFMHSNSNIKDALWPLDASRCLHRMQLTLGNLLRHFHALNALALSTAASSQFFKPCCQPPAPRREPDGGSHCIQRQESECICKGL